MRIHGWAGHDVMEATPEAVGAIGAYLARRGVGAYFPTTVTSPRDETMRSLAGLAVEIGRGPEVRRGGGTPLGIHFEGPFLLHSEGGMHTATLLSAPLILLFDAFSQY